jgi:MA3 domain
LQEYQDSHDVEEARRRLRELALPFVHHEAVKLALLAAMQVETAAALDCAVPLRLLALWSGVTHLQIVPRSTQYLTLAFSCSGSLG